MPARYPERIVCLTEETTETLYLLGEERRIVGISGYTVRPPRARREKPRVSAFLSAQNEKIFQLKPDLVLGFSDLQADIARDLAKAGLNVVLFNQRSVDEILSMVLVLSSMVGAAERGAQLVSQLEANLAEVRGAAARLAKRPKVYFEEWDQPMISAIRWVSELIEIAGGEDVFSELSIAGRIRAHDRRSRRGRKAQSRRHHRLLVRQEIQARARRRASRLGPNLGREAKPASRDQVLGDPAAGPRGAHRWRAPHSRHPG